MEKKYLIANIQIPMEIFKDGKYESLTDFITVDFIQCSELPIKPTNLNEIVNNKYKEMLKYLFTPHQEHQDETHQEPQEEPPEEEESEESEEEEQEEPQEEPQKETKKQLIESIIKLSILPNEIREKKRGHNISFKNTHHKNHNYSMKKYTGTVGLDT